MTENIADLIQVKKVFRAQITPREPTVAFYLESLTIELGERLALVGPSGCGKSTLLNLICGLSRPEAGLISLAGQQLNLLSPAAVDRLRGRTIGHVFQRFNLVPALTAFENVLLGLRFGKSVPRMQWAARAREMLDRVSLGHRRNSRPAQLSIGEQQRVAIARALVNHPPLILADEPTGSLDPSSASIIFKLLLDVCDEGNHALVMVTHDPFQVSQMRRVVDCSTLIQESDGEQ